MSIGAANQAGERSTQLQRAARLLGAAEALHGAGVPRDLVAEPANWLEWDRIVAAVRTQLDASTFEAAWAEGGQCRWSRLLPMRSRVMTPWMEERTRGTMFPQKLDLLVQDRHRRWAPGAGARM